MKDRLFRYNNIMTKKDKILKADFAMSRQVKTHKEAIVNKKENELKAASTRFQNHGKEVKTFEEQKKIRGRVS